jgi:hypothetical protein
MLFSGLRYLTRNSARRLLRRGHRPKDVAKVHRYFHRIWLKIARTGGCGAQKIASE